MGYVEISDGVTTRRIRVEDFRGTVRVEAGEGENPTVSVPADADVERLAPEASR